ncbi:MAG: RibD family protein [Spirochaetales bacterium]|nr:RibD family protein [Spirochaetales bacterium]
MSGSGGERPFVTLTWAQALDGSIASAPGTRTAISGPESLALTHRLRAAHDAILVGVGTVLADDPSLTVRYAEGVDPRPVVLDARLRTPGSARLFGDGTRSPIIVGAVGADRGAEAALEASGARILLLEPDPDGRPHLADCLEALYAEGVRRLMVEGGASVLAAFLAEDLADELVVTVAPRILAGLNPFHPAPAGIDAARLARSLVDARWERHGDDMVLRGRPRR